MAGRSLAIEHDDISHLHDDMAGSSIGQDGGEFFFLVLEFDKFDLHQFVELEGLVEALKESRRESGLADLDDWFKQLGLAFQPAQFGIG